MLFLDEANQLVDIIGESDKFKTVSHTHESLVQQPDGAFPMCVVYINNESIELVNDEKNATAYMNANGVIDVYVIYRKAQREDEKDMMQALQELELIVIDAITKIENKGENININRALQFSELGIILNLTTPFYGSQISVSVTKHNVNIKEE